MTKPDWRERSARLHERFCRTYGKVTMTPGSIEDIRFLALALAGEGGELAEVVIALALCGRIGQLGNTIKKEWRGDAIDADEYHMKVRGELADVRIYLEHLARGLGVDLDEACEYKLDEVECRIAARESRQ